jgi:hypothetical protein
LIVTRARERGVEGVALEWVLWGDGKGPQKGPNEAQCLPAKLGLDLGAVAAALQADLSHNEFGQWSSAEVQHTVIWALKDLARRLRVLQFDMGETFELTDGWAGEIGLPVRPREVPPT